MTIKRLLTRGFSAAILIASPIALAGTASARGGVTQVDGLLTPETTGTICNRPEPFDAAYVVTGTLDGCWYINSTSYDHVNHAGGFVASGTEQFDGCLTGTDLCGTFSTEYKFTAKYDGATEIHGRCHHPIVKAKGTGAFSGVGGVINMHDLPDGCAVYSGHLDL